MQINRKICFVNKQCGESGNILESHAKQEAE